MEMYAKCEVLGQSAFSLRRVAEQTYVLEVSRTSDLTYEPQRIVSDWMGLLTIYRIIEPLISSLKALEEEHIKRTEANARYTYSKD
jgi:hypothetical protein